MLTPAQNAALKAAILAETDPTLVAFRNVGSDDGVAQFYNGASSPAFIVWKSSVEQAEVGRAFVASALSAMTSANNDRLVSFALWNPGGVTPSRADHRQFFDDVFSPASGASTRAALLALWKRTATRVERLFAIGTGSDAAPGTLVFEGEISGLDVSIALRG
jgi:hypothetical protein